MIRRKKNPRCLSAGEWSAFLRRRGELAHTEDAPSSHNMDEDANVGGKGVDLCICRSSGSASSVQKKTGQVSVSPMHMHS